MRDLIDRTHGILEVNGPRWAGLATIDPDLLRRQPEPGEWSALQCLGHTVDTEGAIFTARVQAILDGLPELRRYDPDVEATPVTEASDPIELAARHATLRVRSLETVGRVTEADLDRTARHTELGIVSMRELLNEWAAHDLMHLVQAERAVMQGFIPGSGPWRPYFADHDVDPVEAPA
jgi:DinB family protein